MIRTAVRTSNQDWTMNMTTMTTTIAKLPPGAIDRAYKRSTITETMRDTCIAHHPEIRCALVRQRPGAPDVTVYFDVDVLQAELDGAFVVGNIDHDATSRSASWCVDLESEERKWLYARNEVLWCLGGSECEYLADVAAAMLWSHWRLQPGVPPNLRKER